MFFIRGSVSMQVLLDGFCGILCCTVEQLRMCWFFLQVEVKAMWLGGKEEGGRRDKMVDAVMGVRRPVFKRQYNPTKLNGTSLYHSITMMMVRSLSLLVMLHVHFLFPTAPFLHSPLFPFLASHTAITPLKNFVSLPPK